MSFTYNDEGIRTSKTVNGVTTTYYLNGSQIVAEETSGNLTVYFYDAEGLPQGMQYRGASYASGVWDVYYFERNIFGDIVALYDQNGTKLVSYSYDAWGRQTVTYTNNGASTTAANNPFRYRGYYYDAYLNLYYLNARYYDQNTGRFISPDDALYHSMLGYNMYAYCNNNPVSFYDPTGESAEALAEVAKKYWWLIFLDGQLPIADIIYALILIGAFVAAAKVGEVVAEASQADSKSDSKPKAEEPPKSADEADDAPELDEKGNAVVKPKQQPTEKEGFFPPKGGTKWKKTRDGKHSGWVDKNGNIWVPVPSGTSGAHGGGHWDVQRGDGKGYTNVYPGGRRSGGAGKIPIF